MKYPALMVAAAVFLSGCTATAAENNGTVYVPEETVTCAVTTEEITETETEASSFIIEETTFTVTEIPNITTAETEAPFKMRLPDSFYDEFNDIIQSYPQLQYYNLSLVYCDIESGFTFMLNPQTHFYIASVIKAPYAMYIYRLATQGKADLTEKIQYTEDFFVEGTGLIKEMEFGTELTVEELIGYMLEWSDNCAYAMLRSVFPQQDYIEYTKTLGIVHEEDLQIKNIEKICDQSALCYGIAIYNFIEENNPYSDLLKQHMLRTRERLILSQNGDVVRKYGWYKGFLHDLAVVYNPRPYVLAIMSDFGEGEDEGADENDKQIFKDLSLLFDKYSSLLETTYDETVIVTETTTITTTEKELEPMPIPQDPAMLLSYINTMLRDKYSDLDALCDDLNLNSEDIKNTLAEIDYEYDKNLNKFC